ncbi:hypothetical protein HJC23_009556 [Cyclotella cryptica]|uniref:Uncharacterized protein n=1 Tax=Cyclotella cryptica TaxID=29204 RepID=A0ABD3PGN8_9STRA
MSKEDYPPTAGPVEYMPPRHLGGNAEVWRTLMQFGRIAQDNHGDAISTDSNASNAGGNVGNGEVSFGNASGNEILDAIVHGQEVVATFTDESQDSASITATDSSEIVSNNKDDHRPLSFSKWRVLTPREVKTHQQLGEIDPITGEYTFRTYDMSHVIERRFQNLSLQDVSIAEEGDVVQDADIPSPTSITTELVTVLSTESDGSERDRTTVKTDEEMADDTARLFRRSEISLREKAERDTRKAEEDKRRAEAEERAQRAEERRLEQEERARAAEEGRKYKRSSTTGSSSSSKGRRFSSKKLFRSLSSMSNKILTELNDLNGNQSCSTEFRSSVVCANPKLRKGSSSQAATIEKARDLIDNDEEVEEGGDVENNKPLNLSLYVFGEYDILNDLVNDGAKRLSRSKNLSDLELLLQNDLCPPPDRWVRPTGWSRCNPSSCYAANPPEGYDLNSYGKNLVKLPTVSQDESDISATKSKPQPTSNVMPPKNDETLHPKDSNATQSTAAISASNSEDLFDVTSRPKNINRSGAAPSSPVHHVKTSPTESCGTPQGCSGPAAPVKSPISRKTSEGNSSLKRVEVANGGNSRKSFGRRISGILGMRKS